MYKPKKYEYYWFITSKGGIDCKAYCDNSSDRARKRFGNTFRTKKEAVKFLRNVKETLKERE